MQATAPKRITPETATFPREVNYDDCGEGGATFVEHRRLPRDRHVCEAWLSSPTARPRRAGEGDNFDPHDTAEIRGVNLSRHGVGFVSDTPVKPATFHRIVIGVGPAKIECEVRIAHCAKCEDEDGYYVGAAFC